MTAQDTKSTPAVDSKEEPKPVPVNNMGVYSLIFLAAFFFGLLSILYYKGPAQAKRNGPKVFSPDTSFFSFSAKDIFFKDVDFSIFKGKVILVVNVASECGFTSQYSGLQKLYVDFKESGFEVIGFPSDEFSQELDTEKEIFEFCSNNFGVTFPMMAKVDLNGDKGHPVFKFMTLEKPGILGITAVKWNFEKFLIDRTGHVVHRYSSIVTPEKIREDIKGLL